MLQHVGLVQAQLGREGIAARLQRADLVTLPGHGPGLGYGVDRAGGREHSGQAFLDRLGHSGLGRRQQIAGVLGLQGLDGLEVQPNQLADMLALDLNVVFDDLCHGGTFPCFHQHSSALVHELQRKPLVQRV